MQAVTVPTSIRSGAMQGTHSGPVSDERGLLQTHEKRRRLSGVAVQRQWTVPHYLSSTDPAVYSVGLTFVRRTFGLCVACFAVTNLMSGGLLMLWGNGAEHVAFDDVCYHATDWSCTQWTVDGVLVLFVIPVKFCYGMFHPWSTWMLVLLALFQSANLALIGCYSRSIAPVAVQTYITFEVALIAIWVTCICREGGLRANKQQPLPPPPSPKQQQHQDVLSAVQEAGLEDTSACCCPGEGCGTWLGTGGRRSGWADCWLRLWFVGAASVLVCNFLLMLIKLWLDDEPIDYRPYVHDNSTGSGSSGSSPAAGGHKGPIDPDGLPLDPDQGSDQMFSKEGNLRLIELLMGAPGLPLATKLLDNAKVFTAAMILTFFTVLEAKSSASFCAPSEHILAALFICPPGVPQILGCVKRRHFQKLDEGPDTVGAAGAGANTLQSSGGSVGVVVPGAVVASAGSPARIRGNGGLVRQSGSGGQIGSPLLV